ncbi:MAG: DnaB-like helicase C-terminal domain-containing protein [Elusimicrobiota bacterium]|nr:hypothetical protein [Endomicrobiia bacterium]MDW8165160.1 DnaB-like helicase C-terminal domain-containing protein [Elusimicrobiota bacterium]
MDMDVKKIVSINKVDNFLERYSANSILARAKPGEMLPVRIGYIRLYYGSISTWGGYPGSGKTSLILSILTSIGQPFLYFSLELQDIEIVRRIISMKLKIPFLEIMTMETEKIMELLKEKNEFINLLNKFYISNTINFNEIIDTIRIAVNNGVRLFAIDYAQLITSDGSMSAEDPSLLYSIMSTLLNIAVSQNIHIFIVSQLRKNDTMKKNADINAFFGSASLTQLSSVAVILRKDDQIGDIIHLQVLKNRYGPTTSKDLGNSIPIRFYPEILSFEFNILENTDEGEGFDIDF